MSQTIIPANHIRLGCSECNSDEHDGITRAELLAAIRAGWKDVHRVQSYEQSITVYDNPADAPPGYSVLDWWTHLGQCPDCAAEETP